MGSVIETETAGRVRVLTLNRPESLNALNSAVLDGLAAELERVERDDAIGSIVIRGAGERAFCAGADLEEIRDLDHDAAHRFILRGHRVMDAVAGASVPVIAAVDGWALGGGFELMLACHIVIASDRSRFGLPESKIGCIPGFGGTQRLLTATGKAVALRLMVAGDPIDAQTAWEVGLLSERPVPAAEFAEAVAQLSGSVASLSRTGTTRILDAARAATTPPALAYEAALAAAAISSADGKEGIRAFAERRRPVFRPGEPE